MSAPTTGNPANTTAAGTPARRPAPVIELTAKEVHDHGGVFCPNPKAGMKIWNTHPVSYTHLTLPTTPYV